jgi:hypothetical protein
VRSAPTPHTPQRCPQTSPRRSGGHCRLDLYAPMWRQRIAPAVRSIRAAHGVGAHVVVLIGPTRCAQSIFTRSWGTWPEPGQPPLIQRTRTMRFWPRVAGSNPAPGVAGSRPRSGSVARSRRLAMAPPAWADARNRFSSAGSRPDRRAAGLLPLTAASAVHRRDPRRDPFFDASEANSCVDNAHPVGQCDQRVAFDLRHLRNVGS